MTSEVALLNKSCIALAADSAVTVTYWEGGKQHTRYFKGANKIVNLVRWQPVGVMTFGSANLQGVPWEVIAKAYREHKDAGTFKALSGYAHDFFRYISLNEGMFPPELQTKQFRAQVDTVAARIVLEIKDDSTLKAATEESVREALFAEKLAEKKAEIDAAEFVPGGRQEYADDAKTSYLDQIEQMIKGDPWYVDVPRKILPELANAAILGLFKSGFTTLQSTGLAFAGYGNDDYFPQLVVYRCSGMVLSTLLYAEQKEHAISQENASHLVPLAQSEMIMTFMYGISPTGFDSLEACFAKHCQGIVKALCDQGHLSAETDVSELIGKAAKAHGDELFDEFHSSHNAPLRRVVANLPVSEMAELAETLVYMESLKERVTAPSESVSGPIDVAVISKGDGFIWIKRKHYFDPALNPRFFNRKAVSLRDDDGTI